MRALALLLSFGVGLLSLSQEIVWVRLVSLGQQGRPQAFTLVLVAFLLGLALGAALGRQVCARAARPLRAAGWVLLGAAVLDVAAMHLCAAGLAVTLDAPATLRALLVLVAAGAASKGMLFPIVHHLGGAGGVDGVGRRVSIVYLANVLGATLGPLVTGFWLLDVLTLDTVFALVALGTALLGALALCASAWKLPHAPRLQHAPRRPRWPASAAALPLALAALAVVAGTASNLAHPPPVVATVVAGGPGEPPMRHLLQSRHGVLHVQPEDAPGHGDTTYGGNAYDGRISVDMAVNSNGLDRAYLMATLHPRPRRVLVIGLSTGAWTAAILGMPGVEAVDVVEINPDYLKLIRAYPEVAHVLQDPRVTVHIDDGRRWLRAHPEARYDLVFQNTTFHWRANVTLLLSQQYLYQLRRHLLPGAIVAMNTTGSVDVFATAAQVFDHVGRYRNFAYMSDAPLRTRADALAVLRACRVAGRPAFTAAAFAPGGLAARLSRPVLEPAAAVLRRGSLEGGPRRPPPLLITDLNLVPEYRHGAVPPLPLPAWLLPAAPVSTVE